jgi:hypothetical protein
MDRRSVLGERVESCDGKKEFYYVWNSPIFIVVIGWEMIESSCVTSIRERKEKKIELEKKRERRNKTIRHM